MGDYFSGTDSRLAYDNDHPRKNRLGNTIQAGWHGALRTAGLIAGRSSNGPPSVLHWGEDGYDPSLPHGYDIRDLRRDQGDQGALSLIHERLAKTDTESLDNEAVADIEPIPCDSYAKLLEAFGKEYHVSKYMDWCFASMLAVIFSTPAPRDQIWLRVKGPPGTGKTTLAKALSCIPEHVYARSFFRGFHSGMQVGGDGTASLLAKLNGLCFLIKEGDTLANLPNVGKILSEFRDIFDGWSSAEYLNNKTEEYNDIRTTVIICGTHTLLKLNKSSAGDRFLDINIVDGTEDLSPYLDRAIKGQHGALAEFFGKPSTPEKTKESSSDLPEHLSGLTYGYVLHMVSRLAKGDIQVPSMSKAAKERIDSMGRVVAYLRTRPDKDADGTVIKARKEMPTRVSSQLTRMGFLLAVIYGKKSYTTEVLDILSWIVKCTCEGWHSDMTDILFRHPEGLATTAIENLTGLSKTEAVRQLKEMMSLRYICYTDRPNNSGIGGRGVRYWRLKPDFVKLYAHALGVPNPLKKPNRS